MLPCYCKDIIPDFPPACSNISYHKKVILLEDKKVYVVVTGTDEWSVHLVLMFLNQSSNLIFFPCHLNTCSVIGTYKQNKATLIEKILYLEIQIISTIHKKIPSNVKPFTILELLQKITRKNTLSNTIRELWQQKWGGIHISWVSHTFLVLAEKKMSVDGEEYNVPTYPNPSFRFWKFNPVVDYF